MKRQKDDEDEEEDLNDANYDEFAGIFFTLYYYNLNLHHTCYLWELPMIVFIIMIMKLQFRTYSQGHTFRAHISGVFSITVLPAKIAKHFSYLQKLNLIHNIFQYWFLSDQ